ncbi:MAG: hypothetical protein AB7K36_28550, partial [Chloroflexota bacterium]
KVSSSLTAGRVWVEMIRTLAERKRWSPDPWPVPDGVVVKRIPSAGGRGESSYEEVFIEGQEERTVLNLDWMRPD